jgi:hypothetical protein
MSGLSRVTQSALHIKDRSVLAPDRTIFRYSRRVAVGSSVVEDVVGTYGDYLRDLDKKLAIDPLKTPVATEAANPRNTMLITDLYQGIPDQVVIADPLLPY